MTNYGLHILRFVLLLLLQVFILNNIMLFGFINPYLYPLFIILLPLNLKPIPTLLLAFAIGLSLDFFEDTGGVHAFACVVIAYLRPLILRFAFGINYDYQTLKFYEEGFKPRFIYISIMVFTHHLVLFSLEAFSFQHTLMVLKTTLYSGLFSLFLMLMALQLIRKN